MSFLRTISNSLHPRCNRINSYRIAAIICTSRCWHNSVPLNKEDGPYPFMSKLKQNEFHVDKTFSVPRNYTWKYQPIVIAVCLAIFLTYCWFREEHELDHTIAPSMYNMVPGLEELDLKRSIEKATKEGKDTKIYEDRLQALLTEKSDSE